MDVSSIHGVCRSRLAGCAFVARLILAIVVACCFVSTGPRGAGAEPNLEGVSGLINTPTAEATPDGYLYFGFGKNQYVRGFDRFVGQDQYNYYFNLGFLPRIEITGRVARFPDDELARIPGYGDGKDRVASIKWQALREKGSFPALAVGIYDVGGKAQIQKSYYGVIEKSFGEALKVDVGAGSDRFEGVFGGVSYRFSPAFSVRAEYDTENVNAGVEIHPLDWLSVSAASLGDENWGVGVNARINLLQGDGEPSSEQEQPIVRWDAGGGQADPRVLADRLVAIGFENVRAFVQDGELVVFYENRRFRLEERALGIVATLAAMHCPGGVDKVRVVTLIDGSAQVDFVFPPDEFLAYVRDEVSEADIKKDISVHFHRSISVPDGAGISNPALLKSDLFFRPGVDLDFGKAYGPFRQRLSVLIDPELELGSGFSARGRFSYTFNNDMNNVDAWNTERLWLGWAGRCGNVGWLAKGGYLGIDKIGGQVEAEADIPGLDAVIGMNLALEHETSANQDLFQALGKIEKRLPAYDFTARLSGGRFEYEDTGARVDVSRYFGATEISFFALKTQNDTIEGGFGFFVPIDLYDDRPPSRFRVGLGPDWGFSYRSQADLFGQVVTGGQDLSRYRRRLYPDYLLSHLGEIRLVRGLLK